MWKYLPFAFKNSLRNKRRTVLTVASLSVSLFLLGMLAAIYHLFYYREGTPEEALRLVTRNRVSLTFSLPEYYGDPIQRVRGVRRVCPETWFGGIYIDNCPEHFFARSATEPQRIFQVHPEYKIPPDQFKAFQSDPTAAAVGKSLAAKQNFKLGQKITLKGDLYPVDLELTIRAIFEAAGGNDDAVMYFHRRYVEEGLPPFQKGSVGTFTILADSPESVPRIAREVDEMFRNSDRQTKTESERAVLLGFLSMLGNVKLFLLSISGAVVFTLLLVSANTMALSVRERVKEIGVLKTLGFTTGQVLAMIIAESVWISFLGGVFGCLLAFLVSLGLGRVNIMFSDGLPLPLVVVPVILFVASAVGFMSSILTAFNASRLPIKEALRHVG